MILQANWSKASAFLKYIKGAEIASWVILCDQRNLDSIKSFAKKVMAQAEKKGMALRKGPRIRYQIKLHAFKTRVIVLQLQHFRFRTQ